MYTAAIDNRDMHRSGDVLDLRTLQLSISVTLSDRGGSAWLDA